MVAVTQSALIEGLFASIGTRQLEEQLEKLSGIDLSGLEVDDESIYQSIKDCMLLPYGELRLTAFPSGMICLCEGNRLFRARGIANAEESLTASDFWEAPAKYVKHGRLNGPQQQFLYVSDDPFTPLQEARIGEGDFFLLTEYRIEGNLEVITIGTGSTDAVAGLSADTRQKLELVKDFIDKHFLSSQENAYRVSSILANRLHDFGPDGWSYPSVARPGATNFCLKLHSKERLRIARAILGKQIDGRIRCFRALHVNDAGAVAEFTDWDIEPSAAKNICADILSRRPSLETMAVQDINDEAVECPIRIIP
jgi:hypothetical protein